MTEERAWIERAAAGEREAFGRLVARHRDTVVRTARHILGDAELAEDVAQDAFIRLQAALPGFRGDAELGTWLYRVTLNRCRDHLRSRRLSRLDDVDEASLGADPGEDPVERLHATRRAELVRAAIARLPEEQKEAVSLRYLSDLSYAEIARRTRTPLGTVASRVFRALKRIGQEMESQHLELMP